MKKRSDIIETHGSNLQSLMDEKRLNMAALSRLAGVSVEVIRRIRDEKSVRRDKFFAIAHSLDVVPEEIIPGWNNNKEK